MTYNCKMQLVYLLILLASRLFCEKAVKWNNKKRLLMEQDNGIKYKTKFNERFDDVR